MANPYGILGLRFNQDFACFSVALESGVRIYNVNPLVEKLSLDEELVGSVSQCEMLYRTNLIAIIGGGSMPKFAENTVLIWDDASKQFVMELTFGLPVISVRLRRDKIVCILRSQIHVFRFPNSQVKIGSFDTRDNPRGLCELNTASERQIMIFPGVKCGTLQIKNMLESGTSVSQAPIKAHETELACLAISQNGNICATASTKGTLVRVFDTLKRTLLMELRRGVDSARLYSINFSLDSEYLCVSSDKGTVHIFALKDTKLNKRSKLSKLGLFGQYTESQWGLANFTVPAELPCVCAFTSHSQHNGQSVVAVCVDGKYYKHSFSDSGHCNREEYDVYMDMSCDES